MGHLLIDCDGGLDFGGGHIHHQQSPDSLAVTTTRRWSSHSTPCGRESGGGSQVPVTVPGYIHYRQAPPRRFAGSVVSYHGGRSVRGDGNLVGAFAGR